jgi:hypothetical protein
MSFSSASFCVACVRIDFLVSVSYSSLAAKYPHFETPYSPLLLVGEILCKDRMTHKSLGSVMTSEAVITHDFLYPVSRLSSRTPGRG